MCRNDFSVHKNTFNCDKCLTTYYLVNDKVKFIADLVKIDLDVLDQLKTKVKKFPVIYQFLSEVVAPVYVSKKKA